jgi:dTDP-4-dehydrorhamnose reductase
MTSTKDNRKDEVLILGSEGQLGKSLEAALKKHFSIESVNKSKFDFLDPQKFSDLLSNKTKYVINAAAYTDVEQAEIDVNLAELINGEALKVISQACHEKQLKLFHFSTDYVFDGKKDQPYSEEDIPNPLSIYGKSKLLGEKLIQENTEDFLIFRTSGIISEDPNNFIYKIILASEMQDELKIVSDQKTSLNFSGFLADAVLKILNIIEAKEEESIKGVFNLVGPSYGSWYEFAKFAQELCEFKGINSKFSKINIVPVSTDEMNFKAQRPRFSHLSSDKLKNVLSLSLPNWKKSIEAILN